MGAAVSGAARNLGSSAVGVVETIELPKSVVIKSFRVGVVLLILRVCVLAFILWLVLGTKSYLHRATPAGYVVKWVSSPDDAYEAAVLEDFAKPLCQNPRSFDYKYDDEWSYANYSCISRSKDDRIGWKEGKDVLYIPMSYQERKSVRVRAPEIVTEDGVAKAACDQLSQSCPYGWVSVPARGTPDAEPMCECNREQNFFVAGLASTKIGLEHYYHFSNSGFFSVTSSQASMAECSQGGEWTCEHSVQPADHAKAEMMTLVMVGDKEVHKSVSPHSISVSLKEILDAAGVSIDGFNFDTRRNMFKCGVEGSDPATCREDVEMRALVRQTGLEIHFTMEYLNSNVYRSAFPQVADHIGPLCYIHVDVAPRWVGRPVIDCDHPTESLTSEGACTRTYNYGVQVVFATRGEFGYFDPEHLAVNVGSALAYLMVPLAVISYLVLNCLGPVSSVYHHAAKQQVDVGDALAELAVRMITTATAFSKLAEGGRSVGREELMREVERVFDCKDLNEAERHRLAHLVLRKLSNAEGGEVWVQSESPEGDVDVRNFVACSSNMASVGDVIRLFDEEREKTILERIFRPVRRQKQIRRARARQLSDPRRVAGRGPAAGAAPQPLGGLSPRGCGLTEEP